MKTSIGYREEKASEVRQLGKTRGSVDMIKVAWKARIAVSSDFWEISQNLGAKNGFCPRQTLEMPLGI